MLRSWWNRFLLTPLLVLGLALPAQAQVQTLHPEDLGLTVGGAVERILQENPGKTLEDILSGERVATPEGLEYLVLRTTAPLEVDTLDEKGQKVRARVQFEFESTEAETHTDLQLFVERLQREKGLSHRGLPLNLIEVRSELAPRFPLLDRTIQFLQSKFSLDRITWNTKSDLEGISKDKSPADIEKRPIGLTIARVLVNGTPTFAGVLIAGGGLAPALLAGYAVVGAMSGAFMYYNREVQSFLANQIPSLIFSSQKIRRIIEAHSWIEKNIDLSKYAKPIPSTEFYSYVKWGACLEFAFAGLATVGLFSLGLDVSAGPPFKDWVPYAVGAATLENLFYAGLATWGQGTWDLAITAEREALLHLNDRLLTRGQIDKTTHETNKARIQRRVDFQSAHASFASVGTLGIGKVIPGMKATSFISFLVMGSLGFLHYLRIKRRYPWYFEMKQRKTNIVPIRPLRSTRACGALFG